MSLGVAAVRRDEEQVGVEPGRLLEADLGPAGRALARLHYVRSDLHAEVGEEGDGAVMAVASTRASSRHGKASPEQD